MRKSLLMLSVMGGCALAVPAWADGPDAMAEAWAKAFAAGDTAQAVALYAPGASFFGTQSRELARAPEGVQAYFSALTGSSARTADCKVANSRTIGSVAVLAGTCDLAITLKDGRELKGPARYHMVVERQGDRWLIVDHHLSAMPAPRG